ncbi:MAG TPA: host attachment protein [Gemmatimonadales bacterium]
MSRVITVVLSRGRARFFDVRADHTEELACLHSPETRGGKFHSDRSGAPGSGEHAYHGRRHEEQRRHLAAVADRLMALAAADAALDVALAGPEDVTRAVQASLPAPLRARVIGTLRVDPKRTTASTITRQTKQLQETWAQLVP